MAKYSYNLVDEPWIPCTDLAGNYLVLGLRDLLLRAHELRSLQHQNPLTEAALLRVLLAVVHRAVDGPRSGKEWKALYQAGMNDARVADYLEKWRHRFDLFSPDAPFYQTPGLVNIDSSGKPLPQAVSVILPDLANGRDGKTLFDHTTKDEPTRLPPAEAAAALVTAQMFSFGGLNRKTSNIFGYHLRVEDSAMVRGTLVFLGGRNLFDEIALNLLIIKDNEPIPNTSNDCPVWERHDIGKAVTEKKDAKPPTGYLDLLTPRSRHLLLVPAMDRSKVFVEHIHIAQGEMFVEFRDPGLMAKKDDKGKWRHYKPSIDRLVWRDSLALFGFDGKSDNRPKVFRQVQAMSGVISLPNRYQCLAYSFVNEKGPRLNPLAWRRERLSIPLSLLSDGNAVAHLEKGVSLSEKGAGIVGAAVWAFMREYLPKYSKDVKDKANAAGAVRAYWGTMGMHFHQFLLDLDDPDAAIATWEASVKRTARESLDTCVRRRYRDSARSYKAWSAASEYLNARLANFHE